MGRSLALTLSLGAAVLVLLGTLTTAWWSYESQDWEASMGLSEARFCNADTCRSGPVGGRGNDAERAEVLGEGPGVFCQANYAYLQSILPTGEPDPLPDRTPCP